MIEYLQHFAGIIALKLLKLKWPEVFDVKQEDIYNTSLRGRLTCGRGGPRLETILNHLSNVGVIYGNYRRVNNFSCGKLKYKWFLTIRQEWFEEFLKNNGTKPVFKIEKTKSGGSYKENEPINDLDGYRSINRLETFELLYVLKNPDEFDFIVKKEKRTYSIYRHGSTVTTKNVLLFPLTEKSNLSETVYDAHLEAYLSKHFEWVVELVFKITGNPINKEIPIQIRTHPNTVNSKDKWTHEYLSKRLSNIQESLECLKKSESFFSLLMSKVSPSDDLWAMGLKAFKSYMEENFPCHIYDPDEDLKQLAEWVMLGKNKGKSLNVLP